MSKCPNCGNNMTCGCQRRTASNGASVCSMCLGHYEAKIKGLASPAKSNIPVFPGIAPNLGDTAPTNVEITVTRISTL